MFGFAPQCNSQQDAPGIAVYILLTVISTVADNMSPSCATCPCQLYTQSHWAVQYIPAKGLLQMSFVAVPHCLDRFIVAILVDVQLLCNNLKVTLTPVPSTQLLVAHCPLKNNNGA